MRYICLKDNSITLIFAGQQQQDIFLVSSFIFIYACYIPLGGLANALHTSTHSCACKQKLLIMKHLKPAEHLI